MDSFMDKLAQKFNAQEMIRANTMAEEKELEKRRAEAEEYKAYLQQMKELNQENAELTEKIELLMEQLKKVADLNQAQIDVITKESTEKQEQLLAQVSRLADEGVKTVAEIATINEEKLNKYQVAQNTPVKAEVDFSKIEKELMVLTKNYEEEKKRLAEFFEQTNEYVHRENVKVYRNVQAVVVEEVKNRSEEITKQIHEQNEEVFERLAAVEKSANSVKPAVKVTLTFSIITAIAALGGVAFYVLTYLGIL